MSKVLLPRVVALLLLLTCLVACASQAPDNATSPTPTPVPSTPAQVHPTDFAQVTLHCNQIIDTHAVPGSFQVVLGVVALPTSPSYWALQTARTGDTGPTRLFAKTGLVVKADKSLDLYIPATYATHARIGWGNPAPTSVRLHVDPCGTPGGWIAYAGGYWSDQTLCLPVVVRANGRQSTVHVGVGTACPGQSPPPSPTES